MKLALLRRGEYPEPIRAELEQLVAAITASYTVEHDAEGRQRPIWQRWTLGENQSVAASAIVAIPCRRPDALNTGDLVLDPIGGAVTVQTPGVYAVHGQICWAAAATAFRGARISRNQIAYGDVQAAAISAGDVTQVQVTAVFPCVVGTTIRLSGYQGSGGALNALATFSSTDATFLTITRIA